VFVCNISFSIFPFTRPWVRLHLHLPLAFVDQPLRKALLATPAVLLSFIDTKTLHPDSTNSLPCLRDGGKKSRVSKQFVRRDGEGLPDALVDGSYGGELVVSVMEGAMAAEVGAEFVEVGDGDADGIIIIEFTICW
jgi:hypothetical protein